ncbi:DUF4270 family protein [Bacteroidota bacterium]
MRINILNTLKKAMLFSALLLFFISCEDDLESVQPGFITENKNFETLDVDLPDPVLTTVAVDKVVADNLPEYLLGVKEDAVFGKLQAAIASQVLIDANGFTTVFPEYEDLNATNISVSRELDGVYLILPYYSTLDSESEKRAYVLDSLFGSKNAAIDLKVSQLGEYLSLLNPDNISASNKYYSDHNYEEAVSFERELGVASFVPSTLDTLYEFNRNVIGDVVKDTIMLPNSIPFITIPLTTNDNYFQTEFLDKFPKNSSEVLADEFKKSEDFRRFFKGIYIEPTGATESLLSLALKDAYVSFNYTEYVAGQVGGVADVPLDTIFKEEKMPLSGGVSASKYTHNHLLEADQTNKLYVQGAGGYEVSLDLFGDLNAASSTISDLRLEANDESGNLEWLVNEAVLKVYLDEGNEPDYNGGTYVYKGTNELFPKRLFLCRNVEGSYLQLLDYFNSSFSSAQGVLTFKEVLDENDLVTVVDTTYSYKFYLTDYVKSLLDSGNTEDVDELRLKVYVTGNVPTATNDTSVDTRNWQHKGVVLDKTKTKLRINYSK